jgi:hypothetical protein
MQEIMKVNSGNELTTAEGDLRMLVASLAQNSAERNGQARR